jgi:hypothetical protein
MEETCEASCERFCELPIKTITTRNRICTLGPALAWLVVPELIQLHLQGPSNILTTVDCVLCMAVVSWQVDFLGSKTAWRPFCGGTTDVGR